MQLLTWNLLLGRHHSFDPTEVDVDGTGLDAVHHAAAQLPSVLSDITQHLVALEVMYVPQHGMLGRLGGHPLERVRGQHLYHLGSVRPNRAAANLKCPCRGVELDRHESRRVEGADVRGGKSAF